MLREVQPEHVPDMIEMLWRFGHSDKRILVPETGQWQMKMPHGYLLVGEGPVGRKIEPPLRQEALRLGPPYNGARPRRASRLYADRGLMSTTPKASSRCASRRGRLPGPNATR